jgi:hypothetical protein
MPNVRDDRETPPLVGRDGARSKVDLPEKHSELFLQAGLDSGIAICPPGGGTAPFSLGSRAIGRFFSWWDIVSYLVGIAAACLFDKLALRTAAN